MVRNPYFNSRCRVQFTQYLPSRTAYNVSRRRYLGNCRVYVARILYYYHKFSINTSFLDRNINKIWVFFVKYAHFLLDNYYEN